MTPCLQATAKTFRKVNVSFLQSLAPQSQIRPFSFWTKRQVPSTPAQKNLSSREWTNLCKVAPFCHRAQTLHRTQLRHDLRSRTRRDYRARQSRAVDSAEGEVLSALHRRIRVGITNSNSDKLRQHPFVYPSRTHQYVRRVRKGVFPCSSSQYCVYL